MNYHDILKSKIILMITNDLTIGRSDNDLLPYTHDEIIKFIEANNNNIEKVIKTIIDDYANDNELDTINDDILLDWIGEYLYEVIDTISSI
jgi:transcription termination factor NusB